MAWEALAEAAPGDTAPARHLFCYGGEPRPPSDNGTHVSSKLEAVGAALRWPDDARVVVVWHLWLLKLLPFFWLRRRLGQAKIAVFLHGIEAWRRQDWLTQRLLRRVDLFLTNSDYTWEKFLSYHPEQAATPHRTVHLGLGAPLAGASPAPGPIPAALMVSRLTTTNDYKGHREVLAAWPRVLARLPQAQLWIAGDGDLRPELERVAQAQGLAASVRFLGPVSEEEKEQALAEARCFAMPSNGEGFGLVYLEAMRLGRPCLVSTIDAGREVVAPPDAGLAVDVTQPDLVADALRRLLTPGPAWDAWSERARQRFEARFTAAQFQQRLLAALSPL